MVMVVLRGFLGSGAYGTEGCRALSEDEMSAWITHPEVIAMLQKTVNGWVRAVGIRSLERWDVSDVEVALLEGAVWIAAMDAMRAP